MKSISFNCTKIEHSRTRVCGPCSPRQRKRTSSQRFVFSSLASPCSLPVLLLWAPACPSGPKPSSPPSLALASCLSHRDRRFCMDFFFSVSFPVHFRPTPPSSFSQHQPLLALIHSHPTLSWLAPAWKPALPSRLNEHNK